MPKAKLVAYDWKAAADSLALTPDANPGEVIGLNIDAFEYPEMWLYCTLEHIKHTEN